MFLFLIQYGNAYEFELFCWFFISQHFNRTTKTDNTSSRHPRRCPWGHVSTSMLSFVVCFSGHILMYNWYNWNLPVALHIVATVLLIEWRFSVASCVHFRCLQKIILFIFLDQLINCFVMYFNKNLKYDAICSPVSKN